MSFSMSGLASGINTANVIDQLMSLEKIPYTNLQTKKKDLGTNQTFFRTLNTKLSALKTAAQDLTLSSNFNLSSTKSSDESVVKVSGSASASTGSYNVVVNQLAKSHVMKSIEFNDSVKKLTENSKVTIDGKEFTLKGENDTKIIEDLKNQINKDLKDVSAAVVETSPGNKTLVLTSTQTGEDNKFNSANGPGLSGMGDFGLSEVQAAANAKIQINGLEVISSSNEIKNAIDGVTITALKEGSSSMVTVSKDADKVVEKVKAFVDAFNTVRKMIRTNTAKEQPLQGDSTLRSLDMELTEWVSSVVGDTTDTKSMLAEIGIEMDKGKKGSEMTGELVFNEKVFKEKLAENPEKVVSVFSFDGTNKGIAQVISEKTQVWTSTTSGILNSRIKGYDSEISFVTTAMENMEVRLQNKEKQLKNQFTAMEVAMSKLQNESSWLSAQLGNLSKSK